MSKKIHNVEIQPEQLINFDKPLRFFTESHFIEMLPNGEIIFASSRHDGAQETAYEDLIKRSQILQSLQAGFLEFNKGDYNAALCKWEPAVKHGRDSLVKQLAMFTSYSFYAIQDYEMALKIINWYYNRSNNDNALILRGFIHKAEGNIRWSDNDLFEAFSRMV